MENLTCKECNNSLNHGAIDDPEIRRCNECFNEKYGKCGKCRDYHPHKILKSVNAGCLSVCHHCFDELDYCESCFEFHDGVKHHGESASDAQHEVCNGCQKKVSVKQIESINGIFFCPICFVMDYRCCERCFTHVALTKIAVINGKYACHDCFYPDYFFCGRCKRVEPSQLLPDFSIDDDDIFDQCADEHVSDWVIELLEKKGQIKLQNRILIRKVYELSGRKN